MAYVYDLDGELLAQRTGSLANLLQAETSTKIRPLWRKSFRRANLHGLNLEGVKICASSDASSQRRSDFMGADFSGSDLKFAQFCGLDLRAADFSDCNLLGAAFILCDLDGAKFHRVAMHEHTENKTGYYPSIMRCTTRHMKATGADFTGAMFVLPEPRSDQHMPANMARFEDCEFDRVNFSGDWTNATFLNCDLSNSYPGSHIGRGARWDVAISHDSNIDGMLTKNCDRTHNIIPKGSVEVPDAAWDENGFEIGPDEDGFQTIAAATRVDEYNKAYAHAHAMAEKILAQDAKAKAEKDRLAKQVVSYSQQAHAVIQVQVAKADQANQMVEVANQVVATPLPTGTFIVSPIPYTGGPFKLRVKFSAPLSTGYATVRDHGFSVTGARVTGARRVDRRSDLWELTLAILSTPIDIYIGSTEYLKDKGKRSVVPFTVKIGVE